MGKVIGRSFLALYVFFALLGYLYFGPTQQTSIVTQTTLYQNYVAPLFDGLLSAVGTDQNVVLGQLSSVEGELNYRPSSELVFLPAREGQRFNAGTLLSSGESSKATISFLDNSQLVLEENSTVLLEIPDGASDSGAITLKVLKGEVSAQKTESSTLNLKLVSPRGVVKNVSKQKVLVIAPRKYSDQFKKVALKKASDVSTEEEFVGFATESHEAIEKELKESELAPVLASRKVSEKKNGNNSKEALAPPVPEPSTPMEEEAPAVVISQPLPPAPSPVVAAPIAAPSIQAVAPVAAPPPPPVTLKETTAPKRSPASLPPIREAKATHVLKKRATTTFQAPPEGNDLSAAVFASKNGNEEVSNRLLAKALTRTDYANAGFTDAMKFSLDGIMGDYIKNRQCEQASDTVGNVASNYASDSNANSWIVFWKNRLRSCKSK